MTLNFDYFNINKLTADIETMVTEKAVSYIDACIMYSEENSLEIEVLAEILQNNQKILSIIQQEAENLNFLKKTTRLPI